VLESLDRLNISEDEFFMELRQSGVEHLGQIRLALVEVDGQLSLYFYDDDEMRAGLSILPPEHRQDYSTVPVSARYACTHCGQTQRIEAEQPAICPRCQRQRWSAALSVRRLH